MMLSKKSKAYIFSSDDDTNPVNKSADGATFSVQLDNPIALPREAFDCTLEIVNARAWNTVHNISAALQNNTFYLFYNANHYVVVLQDGLYSVSSLNSQISRELVNLSLPSDVVTITGNSSTQTIDLTFNYNGSYVDFTLPNNFRVVLGFNARRVPLIPSTIFGQTENGDNVAFFNNVENYFIKGDIVNDSIPSNNDSDSILAFVPITASTGNQIYVEFLNPIQLDASNLRGIGRNYFTFRLTDQAGRPAITGESWAFTVVIRYKMAQVRVIN
jgi:hypothetical protein